jgi:release factor glutamine methyltransferase
MTTPSKHDKTNQSQTLKAILHDGIQALRSHSHSPESDALWLLADLYPNLQTLIYSHPDTTLNATQQAKWQQHISRRIAGEPVAYILGKTEFYGISLNISKSVLIPRRETEHVVTAILDKLDDTATSVLELGTGSGAISTALATHRPHWSFTATDCDPTALAVAKANFVRLGLPIHTLESDWFSHLSSEQLYDVIVSNPPYLSIHDPHLQAGDLRFEPQHALVSGESGLGDLHHLIAKGPAYLKPGGYLFVEHGSNQAASVSTWFSAYQYAAHRTIKDYSKLDRVSWGKKEDH